MEVYLCLKQTSMPSLAKLNTLTASSSDDEVYAVYKIPKTARKYNPVKELRDRVPFDIARLTKKTRRSICSV